MKIFTKEWLKAAAIRAIRDSGIGLSYPLADLVGLCVEVES